MAMILVRMVMMKMKMVLMFILNITDLVYSHHDILLMLMQQDNIPLPYIMPEQR